MATISTETHLREDLGSPSDLIVAKVTDHLTPLTRQFVERSPFVCVATSRPDGGLDISPRDDPAGFVRILDDPELLAPSTFDGRAPKLGLVVTIDEAFTHRPTTASGTRATPAAKGSTEPMPGMTVTVRLSGVLAQRLGSRRPIELTGAPTVEDVVAEVGRLAALDADALRGLAVVADGSFLRRDRPVADGEELDVLVPVAGG